MAVLRGVLNQLVLDGEHRNARDVLEVINTVQRLESKIEANPTRNKQELLAIANAFLSEIQSELPGADLSDVREKMGVELEGLRNV